MTDDKTVTWLDRGLEPQVAPNPKYPDGKDIIGHINGEPFCKVDLPYPAKRIGLYVIECKTCGVKIGCTTAGRPDDPRSITIACKQTKH